MSDTVRTEGDGDGIEAPLEVPIPDTSTAPDHDDETTKTLDEIVAEAQGLIARDLGIDMDEDPRFADGGQDDPDSEEGQPPLPSESGSNDDGDGVPDTAADEGDEPAAATEDEGEPAPPAPEPPPPDDEWARVGAALEQQFGRRLTYDDIVELTGRASRFDSLSQTLQSLPPEHQQVVADIVEGRFDPVVYAKRHAPAPDADPNDPFAEPAPRTDPNVERLVAIEEARLAREQQAQTEAWNRQIQTDLARLQEDITAANPDLPPDQFEDIARSVNQAQVWVSDLQRTGDAYDAYRRHFLAHATARGVNVVDPKAASTPATPPAAPAAPAPAPTPELTEAERAQAERRQAAAGAISGTSTPARTRRRSPMDTNDPGSPRPKTGTDLTSQLIAEMESMGLNGG